MAVGIAPGAFAQDDGGEISSYVVLTNRSNFIPWNVERDIARTGADVTRTFEQIGALVVETDSIEEIRRVRNVAGIVPNVIHSNPEPIVEPVALDITEATNPPITGDDDFFFDLQYGHDAVDAQEAWAQGYRGQGVTVAVLDEGFDPDHPDIIDRVAGTYNPIPYQADAADFAAVGDFDNIFGAPDGCQIAIDPNCEDVQYTLPDVFSHGMHVAGTIVASDNAFGTIGVAPEADLLMVKVLSEQLGFGLTEWIVDGIIWAVDNDADIINMSLGGGIFDRNDPAYADYVRLYNRALQYASNNNVLVIAAAGNDGYDFTGTNDTTFPAGGVGVVSVASTGAYGWALSPATGGLHPMGLDRPAYMYSNYGNNHIDIAAPGGDYELSFVDDSSVCTIAGLARPCFVFDYTFSTGNGAWYWSVGTSMASPHAAGVAALIKSEMPWLNDEGIWSEMRRRAGQAQNDINFTSPVGVNVDENKYFGAGRAASDYALPSDWVGCNGQAATLYVTPSGHIASTDMNINGRLYSGTLRGGTGDDVIVGTDGPDTLIGLNGNDVICGLGGDDMIDGGDQNDYLDGGEGADRMIGLNGEDTMYGGPGTDYMDGGDGTDYMDGGDDADMMYGRNGNETMYGGAGDDVMQGEQGNDTMYGGTGDDYMHGGDGDDTVYGEDGNDTLIPGNGNDNMNQ
jgi:subtilisin family serine protease